MFSYVALESRIPADHPLRAIKRLLDPVLAELSPRFAELYAATGRPSFVAAARGFGYAPHVAQDERDRHPVLDGRTTRHPGYAESQRRRKIVEEEFGWGK